MPSVIASKYHSLAEVFGHLQDCVDAVDAAHNLMPCCVETSVRASLRCHMIEVRYHLQEVVLVLEGKT